MRRRTKTSSASNLADARTTWSWRATCASSKVSPRRFTVALDGSRGHGYDRARAAAAGVAGDPARQTAGADGGLGGRRGERRRTRW